MAKIGRPKKESPKLKSTKNFTLQVAVRKQLHSP